MNRDLALLVYDMQVGIAHKLPRAEPVIAAAQRALAAARTAKIPVFFCRHLTWPKAVSGPNHLRGGMALARATDPETYVPQFLRESPGFPVIDELAPTADEGLFDKIGMSAFDGTPLEATLRDLGVSTVAIVGAVLEIGIEPTVKHASELGFVPSVLGDACYTFLDPETARTRNADHWTSVDAFTKRIAP